MRASVDDREVLNWEGDPNALSSPTLLPSSKHLWFGAAYHQFKFHKLELRPLNLSVTPAESETVRWPFDPNDGNEYEWSEPENLGPAINGEHFDEHPELTASGLEMWFSGGGELWVSSRKSLDAPWSPPTNAGNPINDGGKWDSEPSLSADGLILIFCSERETGPIDQNLWMSTRPQIDQPFGKAVKPGGDINSAEWDNCPALSSDGLTLIFTSARSEGISNLELWQASRTDLRNEFGNAMKLGPALNLPIRDSGAHLSSDGQVLLFESSRDGGEGRTDLYFCTRPGRDVPFETPVSFGSIINSAEDDQGPCLSSDGRTLMFYSNRPGGHGEADIWQSRRVRKGAVGAIDSVYLDQLTEKSFVGLGPLRKPGMEQFAEDFFGSIRQPGEPPAHGLIIHPAPQQECRLVYDLGGRYATLNAIARCSQNRDTRYPLTMEIFGDGRLLVKTVNLVAVKETGVPLTVDVRGVNEFAIVINAEKITIASHVLLSNARLTLDSDASSLRPNSGSTNIPVEDSIGSVPLDDLPETAYEGFDQLRKVGTEEAADGSLKDDFPGISAAHGLIVYPNGEPTGTCRLTYDFGGRYETLKGTVLSRPNRNTPMFAEVLGDGKSLWKSGDLTTPKTRVLLSTSTSVEYAR